MKVCPDPISKLFRLIEQKQSKVNHIIRVPAFVIELQWCDREFFL